MDRRTFLKALPLGIAGAAGYRLGPGVRDAGGALRHLLDSRLRSAPPPAFLDPTRDEGSLSPLDKTADFDRTYADDVLMEPARFELLTSVAARLERTQAFVGHGNFNLLSFDHLLSFAANYTQIGAFTRSETELLEEIFFADASDYGFLGEKLIHDLTDVIRERDVIKIAGSGHYLLRGEPLDKYRRIRRDVGDSIALTSGVRSLVKQFQLFLTKTVECNGNLSQASRSLAPPGYSYHARGDFDLGKVGFGLKNFTEDFCETDEYRKLIDLGYVAIRYTAANPYGVRHEPWHVKIT